MSMKPSQIISLVVAAILLGVLLPIALNDVLAFTSDNATVQTLVATVLPILAVVSIIIGFVPRNTSS